MRNLAQYPITESEIVAVLAALEADLRRPGLVGDIRPMVLATVAEIVKAVGETLRTGHGVPVNKDGTRDQVLKQQLAARPLAASVRWDEA